MELMDAYSLTREDWDSINDLAAFQGMHNMIKDIPTKVFTVFMLDLTPAQSKSAFTRQYNKGVHLMPYALDGVSKKRVAASSADFFGGQSVSFQVVFPHLCHII